MRSVDRIAGNIPPGARQGNGHSLGFLLSFLLFDISCTFLESKPLAVRFREELRLFERGITLAWTDEIRRHSSLSNQLVNKERFEAGGGGGLTLDAASSAAFFFAKSSSILSGFFFGRGGGGAFLSCTPFDGEGGGGGCVSEDGGGGGGTSSGGGGGRCESGGGGGGTSEDDASSRDMTPPSG